MKNETKIKVLKTELEILILQTKIESLQKELEELKASEKTVISEQDFNNKM